MFVQIGWDAMQGVTTTTTYRINNNNNINAVTCAHNKILSNCLLDKF